MTLLTALNPPGAAGKTVLKGRLELSGGVEDHEITFATKAISDCATCHREGSAAFQSVTVSVAGPAGIPVRYDANKDVLSSAFSVPSVGGFYAIGGSRITLLDVLLVLALLGGIGGPLGHLTVRWFFRHFVNDNAAHKAGEGLSKMHRIYLHPLPVRIWHWINAGVLRAADSDRVAASLCRA